MLGDNFVHGEERELDTADAGTYIHTHPQDKQPTWGAHGVQERTCHQTHNPSLLTIMILIKICGKVFKYKYLVLFSHNHFLIWFPHNQILSNK